MKLIYLFNVAIGLFMLVSCEQVKDADDQSYNTVKIDKKMWMAENLNVSHYRNGDVIPCIEDASEWIKSTTGAWCYYENKTENGKTYGKLYNWYAVKDPRGLAPEGWRIPAKEDWLELIQVLGGENSCAKKMKSTSGWKDKGNGTNESGFKAFASGARDGNNGSFQFKESHAAWWSYTEDNETKAWNYVSAFNVNKLGNDANDKRNGFAVRCIKN